MDILQKLACSLDRLQAPTIAEMREALREVNCGQEDIRELTVDPVPGMEYGRNVLYRTSEVEAILVHLPSGARTAIHDHGDSVGCAYVVDGEISNVIYRSNGFGMASESAALKTRAGGYITAPHGQIHQMRNEDASRAVTLHLYAPPLQGMRKYRPESEAVLDFVI